MSASGAGGGRASPGHHSLPGNPGSSSLYDLDHHGHKTIWVRGRLKKPHWEAIENGDFATVLKWIQMVDSNIDDTDLDGKCAIHWCALSGNLNMMKLLLKLGAKLDVVTVRGIAPLAFAAGCCLSSPIISSGRWLDADDARCDGRASRLY